MHPAPETLARAAGEATNSLPRFPKPPFIVFPVFCGLHLSLTHWTQPQLDSQRRLAAAFAEGSGSTLLSGTQTTKSERLPIHLLAVKTRGDTGWVDLRFTATFPGGFGVDEYRMTFVRRGDKWVFVSNHPLGFTDFGTMPADTQLPSSATVTHEQCLTPP